MTREFFFTLLAAFHSLSTLCCDLEEARLIVDETSLRQAHASIIASVELDIDALYGDLNAAQAFSLYGIIEYQGRRFFVGEPGRIEGYDIMVMYVKNDASIAFHDVYTRVLLRLSVSGSGWHASPGVLMAESGDQFILSKGAFHYTQETRIVLPIEQKLTALHQKLADVVVNLSREYFTDFVTSRNLSNYKMHITEVKVKNINPVVNDINYGPGVLFAATPSSKPRLGANANQSAFEVVKSINLSTSGAFVPSFEEAPSKSYEFVHPILGGIGVEVFLGILDGQRVEWHMARDLATRKKMWIDRIAFENCAINQYGCCKQVIQSGLLTSKPIDYVNQTTWLTPNEFNELDDIHLRKNYRDITPVLQNLWPIRLYRSVRSG